MEDSIRALFVKEKPVKTLVHLKSRRTENYASAISSAIDCTYSHTVKITRRMEEAGLITSEKKSRKKMLELTDQGEKLAEKVHDLVSELDAIELEQGDA